MAALFGIAKKWKPKCHEWMNEWMNERTVVYTLNIYYPSIKRNEVLIHAYKHICTSKTLSEGKEARYKRSHIEWLYLNELSRIIKFLVECLPLAQGVILESWDWVLHRASCMEPASPLCLCLCLSLCVSLMNKWIKSLKKRKYSNFIVDKSCQCHHHQLINFISLVMGQITIMWFLIYAQKNTNNFCEIPSKYTIWIERWGNIRQS